VLEADGLVRVQLPVASGDHFSLTYIHSVYGVPEQDIFRLDPEAGLVLETVASSAASLEYAALWPTGYLADGTPLAQGLNRPLGTLTLWVDDVGQPSLSLGQIRLDLRALLGEEGRLNLTFSTMPRVAAWWHGEHPSLWLVAQIPGSERTIWQGPVLPGEIFALRYTVEGYAAGVEDRYAVERTGWLLLRQAAYTSLALAGDCSILCDAPTAQGDAWVVEVNRRLRDVHLRLGTAGRLTLVHRGQLVPLYTLVGDEAVRLRVVTGE